MQQKQSEPNLVSIIIPAYNAADLIEETIESIFSQTYKNIELIVVDDGSSDNTRQVVEAFGEKLTYIYQKNSGGCSSPRNNGFRHSKGKFVYFFDADDIMQPDNIEQKVNLLLSNPNAGMVCSDYQNFQITDNAMSRSETHFSTCPILTSHLPASPNSIVLPKELVSDIILQENFTITGSMMFPRSVFEKVGGYDETLFSSEDFDIHYRVLLDYNCGIINTTGFLRRIHGNNMTGNPVKMFTNGINSAKKLVRLEPNSEKKNLLRHRVIVRLLGLSRHYRKTQPLTSLKYAIKTLPYATGFNKSTFNQLLRNMAGAILRRG